MLIQEKDGAIGEHIAWNLSSNEISYALVKLPDGQLCEWLIPSCRVVEERKTSEQVENSIITEAKELMIRHPSKDCRKFAELVYNYLTSSTAGCDRTETGESR